MHLISIYILIYYHKLSLMKEGKVKEKVEKKRKEERKRKRKERKEKMNK